MAERTVIEREITFEEFLADYAGKRYEYVDGRPLPLGPEIIDEHGDVIVSPTKPVPNFIANYIAHLLTEFVLKHDLGYVFGAEVGFIMNSETKEIRAADVAFMRKDRIENLAAMRDWLPFPPDLAVEVISEYDKAADVRRKAHSYMENGAQLLWIVYPDQREIDVYRPLQPVITLRGDAALDGGEVLPGFSVKVTQMFEILQA